MPSRYAESVQRTPLFFFLAAAMLHGLFALTIPTPVDWDPAYYRQVALNIAEGRGAVTQSLLFFGYLPQALPFPADLHWMPLPSRVLVPGLALWEHGDQLITVLLAATWAPLAWALSRRLGQDGMLAGALALLGGGYLRFLSTPDSIALYGALGGAVALALAHRSYLLAALALAAAALTRGDGLLLAPCLALPLILKRKPVGLLLALVGPAVALGWMARCQSVGEPGWAASRELIAQTLSYPDFVLGLPGAPSFSERLLHLLGELPALLRVGLVGSAFLLPWPALWALRRHRPPWALGLGLYALVFPLALLLLTPGVASSGSIFRSGSALFIGTCVLAASGFETLCARRDYPRWLPVPAVASVSLALGLANAWLVPSNPWRCPEGDTTIFATRPLSCERPALLLPVNMPQQQLRDLAERYAIEHVWLTPSDGLGWGVEEERELLLEELLGQR